MKHIENKLVKTKCGVCGATLRAVPNVPVDCPRCNALVLVVPACQCLLPKLKDK